MCQREITKKNANKKIFKAPSNIRHKGFGYTNPRVSHIRPLSVESPTVRCQISDGRVSDNRRSINPIVLDLQPLSIGDSTGCIGFFFKCKVYMILNLWSHIFNGNYVEGVEYPTHGHYKYKLF